MVSGSRKAQAGAMTSTPLEAPTEGFSNPGDPGRAAGPRANGDEIRDLGRLRRAVADRKIAGVAGAIARHLGIDPAIIRVAFVVLVFFGGAGLLIYGACWLLVPSDGSDHAPIDLEERSRTVALIIVGLLAVAALIGDTSGAIQFPWPLVILAAVVLLILSRSGRTTPAATRLGRRMPPAPNSVPTPRRWRR